MKEELKLVQEWDKVFPQSDKVNHKKITFKNHFGITLVADMYEPKDYEGHLQLVDLMEQLKNNRVDYTLKKWQKEDF